MWDQADSESCKRNAAAAEAVCCAPTPAALNPVAYICPRANVSTELNLTKQTYGFEPQLKFNSETVSLKQPRSWFWNRTWIWKQGMLG